MIRDWFWAGSGSWLQFVLHWAAVAAVFGFIGVLAFLVRDVLGQLQ